MTDFRALCSELLQELCCHYRSWELKEGHCSDAIKRARAALDEPEGEGPSDEAPYEDAPVWYGSHDAAAWQAGRQKGWLVALARWGNSAAPAPKPIPVSERLPEDADCLVITAYDGTSSFDEHYCYLAKEFRHCGRVLLIWELKPTSALKLDLPFLHWLPASTRFLPTAVDPAQPT
jgi:hypothetical protein